MAVLEKLKQLLGGVSSAIANLKQAEAGLRERLAEIEHEERRLLSLPAPPVDVAQNLAALVEELGRRWISDHGQAVVTAASGHIERALGPAGTRPADQVKPAHLADVLLAGPLTLGALAAVAPDLLREGLVRVARATAYEPGPSLAGRLKPLAALEAERAGLQKEHASLIDRAAEAGLDMPHLSEEIGRRRGAARAHEAWARDVAANADYYRKHPNAKPPEPTSVAQ